MYEIWRGNIVCFGLQIMAGLMAYDFTGSPKFTLAAIAAVAAVSGLVIWGSIIDDECRWVFSCLIAMVIVAGWLVLIITDLRESEINRFWQTIRPIIYFLLLASWIIPPLWLKKHGDTSSGFWLWVAATPVVGVVVGTLILGWQALTTGKLKIRGKYRRIFG
jgi:hypothetical protein